MKRWEIYLEILCEIIILAAAFLFLGYGLPKLLAFFWPVVAGWIIAVLGHPLRRFLQKKLKVSKKLGSAVIVILVIVIVSGTLFMIGWKLSKEGMNLIKDAPDVYHSVEENVSRMWNKASTRLPHSITDQVAGTTGKVASEISGYLASKTTSGGLSKVAKSVTNGLIGVIVMFLCAYFFLADWEELHKRWHQMQSKEFHDYFSLVKNNIFSAVGGYFVAQFKLMCLIMVLLLIGFLIIGVEYSLVLAVLISILDALPFLGVGTALIPWALYQMLNGQYFYAIQLLILYVVCLLTRQLLQPKVVGDTVGLSPLVTVILMFVGMKISGIIGFIIAVVLGIIVKRLYELGMLDGPIHRMQQRIQMLKDLP